MKRRFGTVIAMVLCFILTVVSVYADDGKGQNPDYVTDYYMIVQSTQGGVDIYDEADTQSVKLNDSKIPNGTAIHVLGEKNGADNKKWAYTQYHGMNGYVPMDDLDPASREEAANEEYRTFGGKDVDFEVKVHGNDGNVSVYNGPGEKFDQVSGTEGIADGTTVHIFQYVQGEDGTNWGKTDTDGVTQGWLNLDRDTDYVNENASADAPESFSGLISIDFLLAHDRSPLHQYFVFSDYSTLYCKRKQLVYTATITPPSFAYIELTPAVSRTTIFASFILSSKASLSTCALAGQLQ